MTKWLFKVIDNKEVRLFTTKMEAKAFRDCLDASVQAKIPRVMRGPDHWKGETF